MKANAESEAELRERIERLEAENGDLRGENKELRDRVSALEAEHNEYRARNELDKAEIRQDLHGQIEDRSAEDENTSVEDIWLFGQPIGKLINGLIENQSTDQSDENNEPDDRRSSLAQLIDLPAEKAKEVLPENGQRARIVAMRLPEFGRKAMQGRWILDSAGVKKLLRDLGVNPHDETASRVMNFIADLGQGDVEDKMHKGDRILVFDPDRVSEYGTGPEPDVIRSPRDVMYAREGGPAKGAV
jgi:hypothetical protein